MKRADIDREHLSETKTKTLIWTGPNRTFPEKIARHSLRSTARMSKNKWGGRRENAGRPRGERPRVRHRPRRRFREPTVLMVTFRVEKACWILRSEVGFAVMKMVIAKACERFETHIVHFAVLGNHLHLIVESTSRKMLSRAMKGLGVRVAKNINKVVGRKGRVISHRHHTTIVRTVEAAHRVIRYVRENFRKHFGKPDEWRTGVTQDSCSSWTMDLDIALPKPETKILKAADPFA